MADSSKDVEVKIALKDVLSEQTKKAESNFSTSMQNMAKSTVTFSGAVNEMGQKVIGAFAGIVAFNKLSSFVQRGISEFKEETLASAKLTQALGYQSDSLKKLAEASAKSTLYKEEEITSAQASLAMYVKNESQIKKLTPAMLDLAVKTGSLSSAAFLIGRAFTTNEPTIARTGIKLTGLAGSQEKLDSITKQLSEHFGGQAEAVSAALGPIGQYEKSMDTLARNMVSGLMPTLNTLIGKVNDLAEAWGWILTHADTENKLAKQTMELQEQVKQVTRLREIMAQGAFSYIDQQELVRLGVADGKLENVKKRIEEILAKIKGPTAKTISAPVDESAGKLRQEMEKKYSNESVAIQLATGTEKVNLEMNQALKEAQVAGASEQTKYNIRVLYHGQWLDAFKKMEEDATKKQKEEDKKRIDLAESIRDTEIQVLTEQDRQQQEAAKRELDRRDKEKEKQKEHRDFIISNTQTMASQVMQIEQNIFATKMNNLNAETEERVAMVEKSNMSETAKAKKIDQIHKEQAAKEKEIRKQQQGWEVASALGSGALAIVRTWEGYAAMGPVGAIMAGIQTALIAGITATQIAAIKSQKFARGGIVEGSGMTDSVQARVSPGEMVLTPSQQATLFNMANSGTTNTSAHYDMSINVHGNTDQTSLRVIRQSQMAQVAEMKRIMFQASRYKQLAVTH